MTAFQPHGTPRATLWVALGGRFYRSVINCDHCPGEHPWGAMVASHICLWVMPTVQPKRYFTTESGR